MQEACIIIYLDLVGYSKMNEPKQVAFFKNFQKILHHLFYDEIVYQENSIVLIPTGDGMIVGLKEQCLTAPHLKVLEIIYELYKWSKGNGIELRTSIHSGSVNKIKDINQQDNIAGNTINDGARMLGGADNGTIVMSKDFFYKYLIKEQCTFGVEYKLTKDFFFTLLDDDVVVDKHGRVHNVYSIKMRKAQIECGEQGKILTKYNYTIYSNDYPKIANLQTSFKENIKQGEEITLVGIYHPNIRHIINNVYSNSNKKVKINLYYASDLIIDDVSNFFNSTNGTLNFKEKTNSLTEIKSWYEKQDKTQIELKIYEYCSLLSIGASMIDMSVQGKGFIHISNYIKSVLPENTPYIEMKWRTRKMPPLYEFYYNYIIDNIITKSTLIF